MKFKSFRRFDPKGSEAYLANECRYDNMLYMDGSDDYSSWVLVESVRVTDPMYSLICNSNDEDQFSLYFCPGVKAVAVSSVCSEYADLYVTELDEEVQVIHVYRRDLEAEARQRRTESLSKYKK